ncbi:MAG: septum formation initiator family protein [Proteobacteria bacterium]|nr:septum formation initiator family protein [Pseudomonadota bacterium]
MPFKKIMFSVVGGLLVVLSFIIVFRNNGLLDLKGRQDQLAKAVQENEKLKTDNAILFNEVKRLKYDDAYLEHVARKELGMIKGDEIIIQFHSDRKK